MTKKEGLFLSRVQDCLHRMAALDPSNPADLTAKLRAHKTLVIASTALYHAIGSHGFHDHVVAESYLSDAEKTLRDRVSKLA